MKITKFVHSCVLVEDEDNAVLFDPGVFSWQSGLVDVAALPKLNSVVVTHKHPDHLGPEFVQALVASQPDVQWFTPADSHADLRALGVRLVTDKSIDKVQITSGNHAPVEPFGVQVQNLVVHWNSRLTHPGDTHEIQQTQALLLLPVQAPWGTTVEAMKLVLSLMPKYVLPIHDWMWNEQWRNLCYDRFSNVFSASGIQFIRPIDGVAFELDV